MKTLKLFIILTTIIGAFFFTVTANAMSQEWAEFVCKNWTSLSGEALHNCIAQLGPGIYE
ncbi:Uncharacterised protein [Yersinia pekkanenii]|uniref:Uncharacterized protein n=1 Tax=Yersinia pekkanenii TaxID=1288385 RepID=A0A0T9RAX2_9GAMM|nr:Uncharacterised protein [Yersinia pekkanenii]CRY69294.1 Uncharacterised protein [Yersinia pekkanenii]